MRKALLFEDLFAFCDFVRLHGSGARSKSGYRLYHLDHPDDPRRILLALVGHAEGGLTEYLNPRGLGQRTFLSFLGLGARSSGSSRARIEAGDGEAVLHHEDERHRVAIRRQSRETALLALIRPQAWQGEPESPEHLLFWLRHDRLMATLVTASLRLGNDRMRYASVSVAPEARPADTLDDDDGDHATMLRIEQPSYFLIQQTVEDLARDVELYYPAAEDLYLPWGLAHPLAELWRQSQQGRREAWVFFRRDGSRRTVEPPRWHDVYDATRFTIDLGEQRPERQVAAEHRIEVQLELVTRANPGEPELWLLGADDRPRLEALLAGVDQEDLANLALSVHATAAGDKLYVVREKRGRKRRFLDFGGRGFAAYKGFANLYLPVDRELLPQLRRDRYRDLFRLRSGELALVTDNPGGETADRGITLYRLDESGFEPLEKLVDYIAADADEELEELVQASVFDLGPYLLAPRSPGLKPLAGDSPEAAKGRPAATPATDDSAPDDEPPDEEPAPDDEPAAAAPAPDPETREIRAERSLLAEGQSLERWLEVLEAKLAAGKAEDTAVAFADTLWWVEDAAAEGPLIGRWQHFMETHQQQLNDPEAAFVAARVLALRTRQPPDLDHQLHQAGLQMREVGDRMRLKLRWLLWREILRINRDVRRQARVREQIREQLSRGLSQAEMPAFLRLRLFDDSRFDLAGDDERASVEEVATATRSLDALAEGLRGKSIGDVALAIVARAYARNLGRFDRAQEVAGQVPSREQWTERLRELWRGSEKDPLDPMLIDTARAWLALFCVHAFEVEDPGVADAHQQRYQQLRGLLDAGAWKALDKIEASLERREKIDNPSALLSAENARRFFPTGGARASGELGQLLEELREASSIARREADSERLLGLLPRVFDEHMPAVAELDPVDIAELLDVSLDALASVRFEPEALPYLRRFEQIADRLARFHGGDPFYFALKNGCLARGLTELGHEERASDLIADAFDDLASANSPIDLIDGSAALLNAVEGLSLELRGPLIEAFAESLGKWIEPDSIVEQSFSHLSTAFYRLFDQAAEAGVSKDKLAVGLFRRYQQHDEFLILDRILRNNPAGGET